MKCANSVGHFDKIKNSKALDKYKKMVTVGYKIDEKQSCITYSIPTLRNTNCLGTWNVVNNKSIEIFQVKKCCTLFHKIGPRNGSHVKTRVTFSTVRFLLKSLSRYAIDPRTYCKTNF